MLSDDIELLKALGPYAEQALIVITNDGRIRVPSGQPAILGYDSDDVEDHNLAEFAHPDDLAEVLASVERILAGEGPGEGALVRARHRDGSWNRLRVKLFDCRDDPRIDGIVLRMIREPDTVDEATTIFGMESLAEALSAGVLAANRAGEVVYANRAAAELFGRTSEELRGIAWHHFIDAADLEEVQEAARVAVGATTYADITCRVLPPDHAPRWVHARLSPLGEGLPPAGWVAVLTDITRQRATESDLAHRATHDPLTGLPNRLLLHDRLDQAIARLNRADDHVAVMFLDIDDFKQVNDTFGHALGDVTLVEMAARIQQAIRPGDTAARVGGDEFVIIAADVDERRALAIAGRIATAAQVRVTAGAAPIHISTSIGVALAGPGEKVDDVLSLADQAMYRAKRESGDRVVMADRTMPKPGSRCDPG